MAREEPQLGVGVRRLAFLAAEFSVGNGYKRPFRSAYACCFRQLWLVMRLDGWVVREPR